MLRTSFVPYVLIAFLVSIPVICTDHMIIPGNGTWNVLELKTLDMRFLFRKKPLNNAAGDIALIVIDETSYRSLNQPLILYHAHISGVIDYLVRCGAKVIALDVEFPSISLENRVNGGYESIYARSFLNARKNGVDIVIGFSSRENAPLQTYLAAAGKDSLAAFSLTEDSDDFIRRQHLYFLDHGQRYDSFPYLIARKLTGSAPSTSDRTILIDFTPVRDIPVYSFADVYRLSVRQNMDTGNPFRNKAVIIGTRLSFEDEHSTPLDCFRQGGSDTRTGGVVIQAATLNTLLSGSIFHEPDYLLGSILILFVALMTVVICRNRRPLPAAALCAGEVCILAVVSLYAFDHLYSIRVIPLLSAIILAYAATTVFHYYAEERKKIKIRQRFASYVPENIIEHLVDVDIERLTEGTKRELALLFCDIRGFTPYSEKNRDDPQKVVDFLNTYHKEMTEIVLANNGTVSQLIGDGMFSFFGAPLELEDPAFDAVKSALQMQERVAGLTSKWREYGVADMRIGIGIHYGETIVGNIGSVKKMVYGAVGDNANIASRIEELTKEYGEGILISYAVYEKVRDRATVRPLGAARIRGHSEVAVYAVDGIITEVNLPKGDARHGRIL
jgi:adenylate cyclase